MTTLDLFGPDTPMTQAAPDRVPEAVTETTGHAIGRMAGFIDRADPGTRAALARLDPEALRPHQIAALAQALIAACLSPDSWQAANWKRWALIAHGMALAGHSKGSLGRQLAEAGVSEPRVTKLLVSREDAFLQIVPRLLRLLASQQVAPNWYALSELILHNDAQEATRQAEVEALRLRVAGQYFSALARTH
jgi:CRISPR system Cascade subunit CasB